MSQREIAIVGKNNTKAAVTGQEELLVKVNSGGLGSPVNPTMQRSSSSGNIPINKGMSISNVGAANGTIFGGITLKPGETVSCDPGSNYNVATSYNATGTEFLIVYLVIV